MGEILALEISEHVAYRKQDAIRWDGDIAQKQGGAALLFPERNDLLQGCQLGGAYGRV